MYKHTCLYTYDIWQQDINSSMLLKEEERLSIRPYLRALRP